MLRRIHIRNVALIENETMEFDDGFSVLTGETGAGKSIIIESFNFVLGERASRDLIKHGAEKASVEAEFALSKSEPAMEILRELEMEPEDGHLLLYRELNTAGKNICRINGIPVTTAVLKQVGDLLIDIHGQHTHQSLLNPKMHLTFLDAFSGAEGAALLEQTAQSYRTYSTAKRALDDASMNEMERARKCDLFSYQINEIEKANLRPGEEEELISQRDKLQNAQAIMEALGGSAEILNGEDGILSRLTAVRQMISGISGISAEYREMDEKLSDAYYQLEDAAYTVRGWSEGFSYDPAELDSIEWRLEQIAQLKRKYGSTVEEVLEFYDKISEEYRLLMTVEERKEQLEKDFRSSLEAYRKISKELSDLRHAAADRLKMELIPELKDLGMPHASFEVRIENPQDAAPGAKGTDNVEFLLSANLGEPLKPLANVASGGELSRIMLAFKKVLAESDGIPTMVFDEIDTGVSGEISTALARKMRQIAVRHQVLCVTHLAQIAAYAHSSFYVAKETVGERTVSRAVKLKEEERAGEIARIMSGSKNDPAALQHASNLLEAARKDIAEEGMN